MISQMIETNTSKFRDIPNEVIIDKISKVAKELSFINDIMIFIEQTISLGMLLSTYDTYNWYCKDTFSNSDS